MSTATAHPDHLGLMLAPIPRAVALLWAKSCKDHYGIEMAVPDGENVRLAFGIGYDADDRPTEATLYWEIGDSRERLGEIRGGAVRTALTALRDLAPEYDDLLFEFAEMEDGAGEEEFLDPS